MQRRVEAPDLPVRRAEVAQPVRGHRRERAADAADPLDDGRGRQRLVRQLQADERERHAAPDDDLCGLGVHPCVELGVRRPVAPPARAAHPDDPAELVADVRRRLQQEGDVRQRPGGHERHRLLRLAQDVGHELDRRTRVELDVGVGQVGPVQSALAVHVGRGLQLAAQRAGGAGGDGDVADARERADLQRVAGDGLQRAVAADGGDRPQVGERTARREQDRERVVVAGVAIEDDGDAHALRRSSHASAARSMSSAQSSSDMAVASTIKPYRPGAPGSTP